MSDINTQKFKKIVVFGGAFNPPTNGHFALAEAILDSDPEVELILFVPVGDFYKKEGLILSKYRLEMLENVASKNSKFAVSTVETSADRCLKTVETMDALTIQYKGTQLDFVIGSDNLKDLPNWVKAEELLNNYGVKVMARGTDNIETIINESELLQSYKQNIKNVFGVNNPINSTLIRGKLSHGHSIRYLVPDEVLEVINHYNLYKEVNK